MDYLSQILTLKMVQIAAMPSSPADLLALGIGAAVIRNRHLVDPAPQPGHLGRHLGFEAESIRLGGCHLPNVGLKTL